MLTHSKQRVEYIVLHGRGPIMEGRNMHSGTQTSYLITSISWKAPPMWIVLPYTYLIYIQY